MHIVKSGACAIAVFLLITGCTDNKELSGKPVDPNSAVTNQLPEPADTATVAETSSLEAEQIGMGFLEQEKIDEKRWSENANGSAGQLYGLVFEAMMTIDEALNEDMKYIAIDFSVLSQLTDEDKRYIEEYMGSFAVPLKDATFDQLKESEGEAYHNNGMVLSGVLLQIDKVEISVNGAVIEGMKYRAGNGAIGAHIELTLEEGAWKVEEASTTWIS